MSLLMCLLGAYLFSLGQYLLTVLSGLCIQFASIIDGCDGEIARMRSEGTPFGAYLDTILDRYADAAIVVGISYAYWVRHPNPIVWVVGFSALMGFILASYGKKEYRIRYNDCRPAGTFDRLTKRDLRLFGLMVGALLNRPYEALVMLGILSHIWVGSSLLGAYTR
jgi:phosphatidylglycerophosphate synthase